MLILLTQSLAWGRIIGMKKWVDSHEYQEQIQDVNN